MPAQAIRTIWHTISERRSLVASVVALGWSVDYTVTLAVVHNAGPELYGVLTAVLSTGAAVANLVLLRSRRTHVIATAAVVVLWTIVALGGIGGTIAHVVGPVAGHGPIDLRPRPIAAPRYGTIAR